MTQRLTLNEREADASEEAFRWMARKMSGAMNADERLAFEEWLKRAPGNRQAFADVERLLEPADGAASELLAEEFERQLAEVAGERGDRGRKYFRMAAGIAAACVVAVVALFIARGDPARTLAYETAIGQSQRVALADGSEIELNTSSRVAVTFDASSRTVALASGEVFFSVEKDRERPFVVNTSSATIAVTGTSFSVSSHEGGAAVHVLTGVVDVAPKNGRRATLLAGDKIEIDAAGAAGPIERFDAGVAFAWRTGKLRFEDAPLGDVVAELNRYFEIPITLADASLAGVLVTGEFDADDRATAIKALTTAFDLESGDEPARTELRRRSDP
jgi:transmembrane sensor